MTKAAEAFRTISEVADDLDVPKHVLRFWEARFVQLKPMKRGGGRRYYRPEDLDLLRGIRHLLYERGFTIKGAQRLLRDEGVEWVKACWRGTDAEASVPTPLDTSQRVIPQPSKKAAGRQTAAGKPPRTTLSVQDVALLNRVVEELKACRELLLEVSPPAAEKKRPPARSRR